MVPRRLRTFGVSAPRCPRVRVYSSKPNIEKVEEYYKYSENLEEEGEVEGEEKGDNDNDDEYKGKGKQQAVV